MEILTGRHDGVRDVRSRLELDQLSASSLDGELDGDPASQGEGYPNKCVPCATKIEMTWRVKNEPHEPSRLTSPLNRDEVAFQSSHSFAARLPTASNTRGGN